MNTPQAKAYLTRTGAPLALTTLHGLEVRNAFKLGIFRELLTVSPAGIAAEIICLHQIWERLRNGEPEAAAYAARYNASII